MNEVYIVAAKRSAFGKYLGSLANVSLTDISKQVINKMLDEALIDAKIIDEVIIGNILSSGLGQNIARQISINSGISTSVCATTINMMCASGLKAIINGYLSISAGYNDVVLTGGVEQMSSASLLVNDPKRSNIRFNDTVDSLLIDGLIDAFSKQHMGLITEDLNNIYQIDKKDQDLYAHNSHQKAIKALNNNLFASEIISVNNGVKDFMVDEQINFNSSTEKMSTLKPVFKADGTISAANASSINDGVSFVMLASKEAIEKHNLVPLAKIVAVAEAGINPNLMGLGPVMAIDKVLNKANLSLEQIDLVEINEAFSLQVLAVIKELAAKYKTDEASLLNKINKLGGAIALGHPIGASGSRLVVSLVNQLHQNHDQSYGLASLCVGGGMGSAIIIKKC